MQRFVRQETHCKNTELKAGLWGQKQKNKGQESGIR